MTSYRMYFDEKFVGIADQLKLAHQREALNAAFVKKLEMDDALARMPVPATPAPRSVRRAAAQWKRERRVEVRR